MISETDPLQILYLRPPYLQVEAKALYPVLFTEGTQTAVPVPDKKPINVTALALSGRAFHLKDLVKCCESLLTVTAVVVVCFVAIVATGYYFYRRNNRLRIKLRNR